MNFSDIRRDFGNENQSEPAWPDEPFALFSEWLEKAVQSNIPEANAMVLSTVGSDKKPSSRVVLLKGFDASEGFSFYTDYQSKKGQQLEANPYASLLFFWNFLERQIRIEGKVGKLSREQSITYFKERPLESQISAMVSNQSRIIESLDALEKQRQETLKYPETIECPARWGGYTLLPEKIEFWQGGRHRMHHRMEYTQVDGHWSRHRLSP
jgi:pyridoxamine 5'-phosphate oxidase